MSSLLSVMPLPRSGSLVYSSQFSSQKVQALVFPVYPALLRIASLSRAMLQEDGETKKQHDLPIVLGPPLIWSVRIPLLRVSGTCAALAPTASTIGLREASGVLLCHVLVPFSSLPVNHLFFKVLRILLYAFCPGFVIAFSGETEWRFLLYLIWNLERI